MQTQQSRMRKKFLKLLKNWISREFSLIFRFAPDVKVSKLKKRKAQVEICGDTWGCCHRVMSASTAAGKNA